MGIYWYCAAARFGELHFPKRYSVLRYLSKVRANLLYLTFTLLYFTLLYFTLQLSKLTLLDKLKHFIAALLAFHHWSRQELLFELEDVFLFRKRQKT